MESARGAVWAWNPQRWQTHDGYVDYHSFLATLAAERRYRAKLRLEGAAAAQIAQGNESAKTIAEKEADS